MSLLQSHVIYPRALRPDISLRRGAQNVNARIATPRGRRGCLSFIPAVWRRCAQGTNRISCQGVWNQGTRRQARRSNRKGDTDWHRPYRTFQFANFPSAGRDGLL
jgi:hypothetical protein